MGWHKVDAASEIDRIFYNIKAKEGKRIADGNPFEERVVKIAIQEKRKAKYKSLDNKAQQFLETRVRHWSLLFLFF